ncbi:alcohol oxidase [Xylariomycetidae sp. FL2044]|nr:alcohol oxidase [Xylariomycetidae sp. FL2044]
MVHTSPPPGLDEVDIIVIGGGTAGSVIAARLADADPSAVILVIEGGPDNYNVPTVIHTALYRANFGPQSNTSLKHISGREAQLADRSIVVAAGGVLGGGSSVNGAVYARAQQVDYDSWDTPGWSSNELLPFLKRFESYHPRGDEISHGRDGPVHVSRGTYDGANLQEDFVSALKETGFTSVEDLQDLETNNAVSTAYRYVSPEDGRRQDSAHAYLHPRLQDGNHKHLHVLVQSRVIRVLFDDNKRASGVTILNSPGDESGNTTKTIMTRKLIVLSAGALGSPQILERSGVGPRHVLDRAGIPIVSDLPGVGHDYQDHNMIVATYDSNLTVEESVDSVTNGALNIGQLLGDSAQILSWNGFDASSKIRPTEAEVAAFSPGMRLTWDQHFAHTPNKPLGSLVLVAGVIGDPSVYPPERQYFSIGCYNPYPLSRGHVHITGAGMDDPLDFKTGFLSDTQEADLATLVWLYKKQHEGARRMSSQRGQVSSGPDSIEDDGAIEQWIRENVSTTYHSLGTCKMAPREKMGVVDSSLNVHGVTGLKVADMSIAPENVSANTMSTALLIGEKAAEIFIKELGFGEGDVPT